MGARTTHRSVRLKGNVSRCDVAIPASTKQNGVEGHTFNVSEPGPSRERLTWLAAAVSRSDPDEKADIEQQIASCKLDQVSDINFLLTSTIYFENIGEASRALDIALLSLKAARQLTDSDTERRAQNVVGVSYSRVYNFERSCFHLNESLKLARSLKCELAEFATLCNTVAVLQLMGLSSDAVQLAFRLSSYCGGTPELDYLHLQNAINGAQLSKTTGDSGMMRHFTDLVVKKLRTAGLVGTPWKVYVDAICVECAVFHGDIVGAQRFVTEALAEYGTSRNLRVRIILATAEARLRLYEDDRVEVARLVSTFETLLAVSEDFPLHKEDVLRSLLELLSANLDDDRDRAKWVVCWRALNRHLVTLRHRQFYRQLGNSEDDRLSRKVHLAAPSYVVPLAMLRTVDNGDVSQDQLDGRALEVTLSVKRFLAEDLIAAPIAANELTEAALASPSREYSEAENWAVAAEFALDRSGQHCFDVGFIAGTLAVAIGLDPKRGQIVELACRLHDIGKVVISEKSLQGTVLGNLDEEAVLREHTLAGARLLSDARDPILVLAASVARSHHESWNGCGFPDGLRGSSIPLEARLCAVADSFVRLLRPSAGRSVWLPREALRQVAMMSGVQLDPDIVAALVRLFEQGSFDGGLQCLTGLKCNPLRYAKSSLMSTAERLLN